MKIKLEILTWNFKADHDAGNLLSVSLADRVDRNMLMAGGLLVSGAAALAAYYSEVLIVN